MTQVTPQHIGPTQAMSRLEELKSLIESEDYAEAAKERAQLCMDVLFSIANASGYADKAEMRRLAGIALESYEIPMVRAQQT